MIGGLSMRGAEQRLLHASVPGAFFGLAILSQAAFWAMVGLGANDVAGYRGGTGLPLAAIHVLTIGLLLSTAFGATQQILPVATLLGAPSQRQGWTLFLPLLIAAILLPYGFATHATGLIQIGATFGTLAVGLYMVRLSMLLRAAQGQTLIGVRRYLWAALVMVGGLAVLALLLATDYSRAILPDHGSAAVAHLVLGAFGFMGLMAAGLSNILIPMLAISEPPSGPDGHRALPPALTGLGLSVAGLLADLPVVTVIGIGFGLVAAAFHVALMARILKSRMRKRLDHGFALIVGSWALLPLSLIAGAAAALDLWPDTSIAIFAILLLPGWLMTLVLGILQRILPFLASMHTMQDSGLPARVSVLTWLQPLRLHAIAHATAVALLLAGVVADQPIIVQAAGLIGLGGALSFVVFAVTVALRTRRHLAQRPLSKAQTAALSTPLTPPGSAP